VKATPLLVVEDARPTVSFFENVLGFEIVTEVQHGDALGFAILVKDGAEVMVQTRASVESDMNALSGELFRTIVYMDVEDVSSLRLEAVDVVVPFRTTFYHANEVFVREPGGNVVGLSSPARA
jgi:uncharacterized glyoxalase superfamily protein PhnB